jgi:hypothetical protein
MALGLSYRCSCGKKFKIYMPKRKLFSEIVNRVVDWHAIDNREEADGEVDEVQRIAMVSRCEFIDARRTDHLICGDCTGEINLTEHFRTRLVCV